MASPKKSLTLFDKIDEKLTPSKVKAAKERLNRRQRRRDKKEKEVESVQPFTGSKMKKERLAKNKAEKEKIKNIGRGAVSRRKKQIAGATAGTALAGGVGATAALSGNKEDKKTGPQSRLSRRTERTPGTAGGTGGQLSGGAARRKSRVESGQRTPGTAGGSGAAPKTRGRVAGKTGGAKTTQKVVKPKPTVKPKVVKDPKPDTSEDT